MTTFEATIRDSSGSKRRIRHQAANRRDALDDLRARGFLVLSMKEAGESSTIRAFRRGAIGSLEQETGLRQLSSLLRSGVTLVAAIDTVGANSSRRAARVWEALRTRLMAGSGLAEGMVACGKAFDPMTIQLAAVGEKSGELDESLARAAAQIEARRTLGSEVANALAYPAFAAAMAFGVAAFLVTGVIPKIADFLSAEGAELPVLTQWLVDASRWMREHGLEMLLWMLGAGMAWRLARFSRAGREAEDAFILRIPLIGKILRLGATAIFARTMQMMLASGVSLLDALEAVPFLMSNTRLRMRIHAARTRILSGASLEAALSEAKEFPAMFLRMVAAGEATGNLAEVFDEAARHYESALAHSVKRFSMIIEPVTILITGALVGFVYVAFFMALFSMASAG